MADVAAEAGDGRSVILVSEDEEQFSLPWKAAIQSELIRLAVTDDDEEDEEDNTADEHIEPIKMHRISSPCLKKVVEFLVHHSEDPMHEIRHPLPADSFNQVRRTLHLTTLLACN